MSVVLFPCMKCIIIVQIYTVKPVYKGYSKDPENGPFMGSCPLYTG